MLRYNTKKDSYKFLKKDVDSFINVGLQVTRRCNLQCVHCCEPDQIKELSLVEIKNVIDELSKGGLKKICITGGEPFLRNDLDEITKYATEKGMFVTLSTNGFILNDLRLLNVKPYINNIRFSLHGTEKNHNEVVQNKNGFKKVMDSIQLSNKLGVPVSVVASIFAKNYSDMIDIARICERQGVEKLYFFSLISRGRAYESYDKEYVPFEKIKDTFKRIKEIAKEESWNLDMNIIDWSLEGQCVLVFPDGSLAGVPSFKDKDNTNIVGNILKENMRSLWDKYQFKNNYINYYKNH
ncbi:MAG: radical SAM protein [Candidatus Moranbacteria bacterium]|nr:radical SAM protein [Candidatus Moranbacteria bacterium]